LRRAGWVVSSSSALNRFHVSRDIERGKEHGARIGGYVVRFAQLDGAN